jgi:two-component system, chemotaxis family, response regulator Rcp1
MNRNVRHRPLEILLVDDNPAQVRLVGEALQEAGVPHRLAVAGDGEALLARLRPDAAVAATPPDLILLDLNLPGRSGLELLAEIKSDPALCQIPVVMFSTSRAEQDIAAAYRRHANCYIHKPGELNQLIQVMRGIGQFWSGLVQLPPHGGGYG